jgi:hypothetical protein
MPGQVWSPSAFRWLEPSAVPPDGYSYLHWGQATPQNQAEPNNAFRDELCAVANYSQAYQGGSMQAWGWSDARCNMSAPFICKLSREWLPARPVPLEHDHMQCGEELVLRNVNTYALRGCQPVLWQAVLLPAHPMSAA